ncbi:MAG: hypothetical protein JWP00_4542 [Chloroflexi bacterium]|jgi:uncharacterized protein (DUF302 family)|nr:hypothetical protein [Chloroflexota bacterium]
MKEFEKSAYGFGKEVNLPFAEAVEQTKAALKEQGFGVLTEIDMKQTMKEKRGIDFVNYAILGACNPPLAEQALAAELEIGLLLPCNVIVYEKAGHSVVKAMDPEAALGIVNNPVLVEVALAAKARLQKALESLPDQAQTR